MSASRIVGFALGLAAAGLGAGLARPDLPLAGPLAASLRDALLPAPPDGAAAVPVEVYYQYVDRGGAVRFVRRLEDVPADQRAAAGRVEIAGPPPGSAAPRAAGRAARASAQASATGPAKRYETVELYTTSWCPHCRNAIADLSARGVDFRVREIDTDIDAKAELKERGGDLSVPQLFVDGSRVAVGYSEGGYDRVFGAAR